MNKELTLKLLKLIQSQFPTSGIKASDDDLVKAWQTLLAGYHPRAVFNAYEHFLSKGDTFPPTAGQIAARAKIEHFPLLGKNPVEHRMENTLFYQIYCHKYGNPPAHNVRGDVDTADKWMNKYATHMKKSIADMMAASNERVQKYIIQWTEILEKVARTRIENHTEPEVEKPISPTFIAKFRKDFAGILDYIESGPHEPTEETKARWERNKKEYSEKVMRRIDGLKPTQSYTIEVPADDPGHGLVYTCKRTKYLRGEQSIEPRSGAVRTYLD